jgi:arylsulfatase A-like enzyme
MANPEGYRPHIVFVMSDQQRYDTIGALGFPHVDTPNLDRLARDGAVFTHCYITAPSCVPSRCSLFQGYYPHTTGVYKNGDHWSETWVADLADAGYRCVNVGKMHTVPFAAPAGFHERYTVENKDRYLEGRFYFDEWDKALRARGLVKQQRELYRQRDDYRHRMGAFAWELDADMQSDNFVGGLAAWWLRTYPLQQPLFLQVGFPGPHPPYDPTPDFLNRYLDRELPMRRYTQEEIDAQPEPMRALRRHMFRVDHDSVFHLPEPTPEQRRFQRAAYLANVSMIDENVGSIVTALAEQEMLDDTVIIFVSDHGDCLGDHGQIQKWNMYEEVVRVPAIMWWGETVRRHFGLRAGEGVDSLVSLMDFGPTILDLAGARRDPEQEAVSLLSLLGEAPAHGGAGPKVRSTPNAAETPDASADAPAMSTSDSAWDVGPGRPPFVRSDGTREYVFAEHGRDNILEATDVMTMVRDERWKLVTFSGYDEGQLFDLRDDPDERLNRWDDPGASGEKRRLLDVLHAWYRESLYHTRTRRRR